MKAHTAFLFVFFSLLYWTNEYNHKNSLVVFVDHNDQTTGPSDLVTRPKLGFYMPCPN